MMLLRETKPGDLDGHRDGDYTGWNDTLVSMARTLECDGKVIAVLGVEQRFPGVADIWTVFTDEARGMGRARIKGVLRICRSLLTNVQVELKCPRLNAWCRADQPEYLRWAKLCGFEAESYQAGAGPYNVDIIGLVRWVDCLAAAEETPAPLRANFGPNGSQTHSSSGRTTSSSDSTSRPVVTRH